MRDAPAPTDERAYQHRDSNRKTDQMSNPDKRKRQKEIETARRASAADPKCVGDVGRENSRRDNHCEDGGHD
jgi:hypothetical protein